MTDENIHIFDRTYTVRIKLESDPRDGVPDQDEQSELVREFIELVLSQVIEEQLLVHPDYFTVEASLA